MKKNKKAVSGVVAVVIMIALVMAIAMVVWIVVNNLVTKQLGEAESCFMVFGKVTLNHVYTCYNSTSNEFQFSINIGDIVVDGVLISISGEGKIKSFEIGNTPTPIGGLKNYPDGSLSIKLPKKNGGLTYIYDMSNGSFSMKPDSIAIVPIVGGQQCDASDSSSEIDDCLLLA